MESHAKDCAADINNRFELGLSDADFRWLTNRIQKEILRASYNPSLDEALNSGNGTYRP